MQEKPKRSRSRLAGEILGISSVAIALRIKAETAERAVQALVAKNFRGEKLDPDEVEKVLSKVEDAKKDLYQGAVSLGGRVNVAREALRRERERKG